MSIITFGLGESVAKLVLGGFTPGAVPVVYARAPSGAGYAPPQLVSQRPVLPQPRRD